MWATKKMLFVAMLVLAIVGVTQAAPTAVKPTHTWKGSVTDEKLQKDKPENGVITDAKTFEKLIKAWKVAEKVPEVDFTKEVVFVDTTVGSLLNLSASLDEKGDLKVLGLGTSDFGEGFRYVILSLPREGVKTVNGKALPK
jgi:hypothetical protein